MFRIIPLGQVFLIVGGVLTLMGFVAYGLSKPTLNLIGFFYGVPLLLGGLALKSAELKPTPYSHPTPPDVVELRNQQATDTQNQIRKDVTRYRYGQEAHLDESLERLDLSPSDDERPVLQAIREEAIDGYYALILEFNSPFVPLDSWQTRQERIEKYFGPNIVAKISQPEEEENKVEVALIVRDTEDQTPTA
ncbi:DUF2854 domain-containing protein [Spirulina sp. CS-785/01]|uniref:DUF2854 domain-containing protein n=1 Tax=Spirulina sp. CS-785/01 TaxID=3021716 RepID=UPI00232B87B3|nr:DUF2854 domain-containing protein [Spirulina sp. CS-785/01]MDB9313974.1 DUF2854 domain-containing protein [Spirulina sp. CS-785/01]